MKTIRLAVIFLLTVMSLFIVLIGRCLYLQYFRYDHYHDISSRQQHGWMSQPCQRGVILDRRGRVLAASNKVQTIFAEPRRIKDPKETAIKLASVVHLPAHEVCQTITESKNPGFAKILTQAEPNTCQLARKIAGIGIQSDFQRYYPMGELACHVVGFTSLDNRGLEGVELYYNRYLTGQPGRHTFIADPQRRPIRFVQQQQPLVDGNGIVLTIDSTIQQFVHDALYQRYTEFQAESAMAIVAEPKTGAILAMVSLPDYHPQRFFETDPNWMRNRALTDQFEPGSIIKPLVVAIALDAGVIQKDEVIFCEDGHYHGKGFGSIHEYDYHKYGHLKIREIIIKSSNIGMAKIGQKLERKRLYDGLKRFGFGRPTGIDLKGEAPGMIYPLNKWTGYSVTRVPFGHEMTVTGLQIVQAYCILANGGHMIRPYIVQAVVDNEGNLVHRNDPLPPVGFVVKPEVAKWVATNPMVGVINEKKKGGTGWRAKLDKWQVFGKTGTADLTFENKKGYSEDTIASFVCGAPAEDPKIVVLVSIRRPNRRLGKGHTGGAVASPVAKQIIEKTLTYFEKNQFAARLQ